MVARRSLCDRQPERVQVEDVYVGERRRPLNPAKVDALKESIARIGQMQPISVHVGEVPGSDGDEAFILVAGAHRLEAARQLGKVLIDAVVLSPGSPEIRLWEISENLHRADLTAVERAEHIAAWIRLTEEKPAQVEQVSDDEKMAQVEPFSKNAKIGAGRGNKGGVRAAARDLGISRGEAQRACKIDSLTPEAKAAARETGLDNNRSALLQAAKVPPEQQPAAIRDIANSKPARRKAQPAPIVSEYLAALRDAWMKAPPKDRRAFLAEVSATDATDNSPQPVAFSAA